MWVGYMKDSVGLTPEEEKQWKDLWKMLMTEVNKQFPAVDTSALKKFLAKIPADKATGTGWYKQ